MKKLLGVSIAAMLAVTPMLARADYTTVADDAGNNIATTNYVKGAYNALVTAKQDKLYTGSAENPGNINANVATTVRASGVNGANDTTLVTEKAVRDAIDEVATAAGNSLAGAAGDGLVWDSTDIEFDINLANKSGLKIDDDELQVDATDGVKVDSTSGKVVLDLASDKGLQVNASHKLEIVDGAGIKTGSNGIEVDLTTNGGLATDNSGQLGVVVDGSTVEVDATSGALKVKSGVFDASGAASGVQSAIEGKLDDGAAGYDINAKSLQVQGKDVATKVGVTNTISASTISGTVPVYTTWNQSSTANVNINASITGATYAEPAPAQTEP